MRWVKDVSLDPSSEIPKSTVLVKRCFFFIPGLFLMPLNVISQFSIPHQWRKNILAEGTALHFNGNCGKNKLDIFPNKIPAQTTPGIFGSLTCIRLWNYEWPFSHQKHGCPHFSPKTQQNLSLFLHCVKNEVVSWICRRPETQGEEENLAPKMAKMRFLAPLKLQGCLLQEAPAVLSKLMCRGKMSLSVNHSGKGIGEISMNSNLMHRLTYPSVVVWM